MDFHLGIEDMEPNSWIAWVFELPGCYARATTREEASTGRRRLSLNCWNGSNSRGIHFGNTPSINTNVVEEFRSFPSSPDYIVNAFFDNDRIPLTDVDIKYAQHLLSLNRNDLLAVVANLPAVTVDREITGEVQKNIKGILRHIARRSGGTGSHRFGLPARRTSKEVFQLLNKIANSPFSICPSWWEAARRRIAQVKIGRLGSCCAAPSGTNAPTPCRSRGISSLCPRTRIDPCTDGQDRGRQVGVFAILPCKMSIDSSILIIRLQRYTSQAGSLSVRRTFRHSPAGGGMDIPCRHCDKESRKKMKFLCQKVTAPDGLPVRCVHPAPY